MLEVGYLVQTAKKPKAEWRQITQKSGGRGTKMGQVCEFQHVMGCSLLASISNVYEPVLYLVFLYFGAALKCR